MTKKLVDFHIFIDKLRSKGLYSGEIHDTLIEAMVDTHVLLYWAKKQQ